MCTGRWCGPTHRESQPRTAPPHQGWAVRVLRESLLLCHQWVWSSHPVSLNLSIAICEMAVQGLDLVPSRFSVVPPSSPLTFWDSPGAHHAPTDHLPHVCGRLNTPVSWFSGSTCKNACPKPSLSMPRCTCHLFTSVLCVFSHQTLGKMHVPHFSKIRPKVGVIYPQLTDVRTRLREARNFPKVTQ